MSPFSWLPTFSAGLGSARIFCSLSGMVASSVTGHWVWDNCFSWGGGCGCSHLGRSRFGAACAKSGQTFPCNVAERGLAVRPLWTVSQPSASFLPNKHIKHFIRHGDGEELQATNTFFVVKNHTLLKKIFSQRQLLTQFFPHGCCWLIGVCYRLRAFHSICPTGAWVWEPWCSKRRWGTTEKINRHYS